MTCSGCDGTGRLYTSSWDDEGFACPTCACPDCDGEGVKRIEHATRFSRKGARFKCSTCNGTGVKP